MQNDNTFGVEKIKMYYTPLKDIDGECACGVTNVRRGRLPEESLSYFSPLSIGLDARTTSIFSNNTLGLYCVLTERFGEVTGSILSSTSDIGSIGASERKLCHRSGFSWRGKLQKRRLDFLIYLAMLGTSVQ